MPTSGFVSLHGFGRFTTRFSAILKDITPYVALTPWAVALLVIQIAQLASLLNFKSPNDYILTNYNHLLGLTRPANWISDSQQYQNVEIILIVYLLIMGLIQLNLIRISIQAEPAETTKLLVVLYKNMGKLFEFVLFIPITEILCISNVSMMTTVTSSLKIPLAALLGIVSIIYFIGKFFDVPLRTRASDRLLNMNMYFDIVRAIASILLVVIAKETNSPLSIGIPSCIYAAILILLGMICSTFRNKNTRRAFLALSAFYFIHSLTLQFISLKQNTMYVMSNSFSLFLLLAVPLGIKLSLVVDDLVASKMYSGGLGHSWTLAERREREIINEILNAKYEGKNNFASNPMLEVFIANHLNSCKDNSCFCVTWSLSQADESSKVEDLRTDFIENYYEQLLKKKHSKGSGAEIDTLIELILLQAFYLDRPFKACFTWARFSKLFQSFTQKFVLESLLRLVEDCYIESLSKAEKEFQKVKFHRGITFEHDYDRVLHSFEAVRKAHCEFYQYLVDNSTVSTDKIFSLGSVVQKSLEDAKTRAEDLTKTYEDSPEAMVLYLDFNREILYSSSESTRRIEGAIAHLYAKKHERQANNGFNALFGHLMKFDYFDAKNIFLKIDFSSNNGVIRKYNSVLLSDLGIEDSAVIGTEMTLRSILPSGVRDDVAKTLSYISSNLKSQESLGHYMSLVFLSHVSEILLPYKASLKIEFDQESVFAAIVLQKLKSNSQYILTKPSGEIVSLTKGLLDCFGLQHVSHVQGHNICFLIPKLFKYYLDSDQVDNRHSFPHDGIYTQTFSATACLSNEYISKYKQTAKAEVQETIRCLNELNNLQLGEDLVQTRREEIIKHYVEATQKIDIPLENTLKLTLRLQKYEHLCSRFRVIEIYNYRDLSKNQTAGNKREELMNSKVETEAVKPTFQEESQTNLANERRSTQSINFFRFKSEKSTFFQRDSTMVQPDFEIILPDPIEEALSGGGGGQKNTLNNAGNLQTFKAAIPIFQRNVSESLNYKLFKVIQEDEEQNLKIVDGFEQGDLHSSTASEKMQIEKKYPKKPKKAEKKKKLFAKGFFNSTSSQGSTTSSVLDRNSAQSLIERNVRYRIIDVFLILGLLGVGTAFVLFSIQCFEAQARLNTLGELSRSTGYPLLNSDYLNNMARNAYEWELALKGFFPVTAEDLLVYIYEIVPGVNAECISNLVNMSLAGNLNEMLYDLMESPTNSIEIDYPNGTAINMSLLMASNVLFTAAGDYYNNRMIEILNTPRTQMDLVLMTNTSYVPADISCSIGEQLTNQIHTEISDNLSLNSTILGIIALLISGVGIGFLLVYNKIVNKRAQMLGLFCRISKNELLTAWERINGMQISHQGVKMNESNSITRNKERQKERFLQSYYSNSSTKYMGYTFIFIVGVFMIPFLVVYIWLKNSLATWELTIDQVNNWGITQAKLSALMRLSFEYYYNLQGNISNTDLLEQRKETIMQEFGDMIETVEDFFSEFGNLPNQDIYDEATTAQINGGRDNMCPYLQVDAATVAFCDTQTLGVANEGAIATLDYVKNAVESDWNQVAQSNTPIQTMIQLSADIFVTGNFQIIVDRFFFVTGNMMKGTLNDYINSVSRTLIVLYCGISVGIIVMLGVFWILFLKRMQMWLNKSKSLLKILPPQILKTHSHIRNYLKKELKHVN